MHSPNKFSSIVPLQVLFWMCCFFTNFQSAKHCCPIRARVISQSVVSKTFSSVGAPAVEFLTVGSVRGLLPLCICIWTPFECLLSSIFQQCFCNHWLIRTQFSHDFLPPSGAQNERSRSWRFKFSCVIKVKTLSLVIVCILGICFSMFQGSDIRGMWCFAQMTDIFSVNCVFCGTGMLGIPHTPVAFDDRRPKRFVLK